MINFLTNWSIKKIVFTFLAVGTFLWLFLATFILPRGTGAVDDDFVFTERIVPPYDQSYNDVFVVDDGVAYIVGQGGVIIKTTDGFDTTVTLTSGVTDDLNAINCKDPSGCVAVGDDRLVLRTTNGGGTWAEQRIDEEESESINFSDIFYSDNDVFFIVSDTITEEPFAPLMYKTTNGGETWEDAFTGNGLSRNSTNTLYFLDGSNGYAAGRGDIFSTADGGVNWQAIHRSSFAALDFRIDVK